MLLVCASLYLIAGFPQVTHAGNVLVWPAEASHWLNIRVIMDELIERGHQVTVIVPTGAIFMKTEDLGHVQHELLKVNYTKEGQEVIMNEFFQFWIFEFSTHSYWEIYKRHSAIMVEFKKVNTKDTCMALKRDKGLISRLRDGQFDVLLSDPIAFCGDALALMLGIPYVYSLRFTPSYIIERYCGAMPAPPSYVPMPVSNLPDHMHFWQRVQNTVMYFLSDLIHILMDGNNSNRIYAELLGEGTTICEVMSGAEFWLIRNNWDLDFPRPFPPNFVFVGGLHCKPANPLPEDLEEFAQSSGEHGLIVFSLGSMIKYMPMERAELIASALAQLPQKVVWRYEGEKPSSLGSNTKLVPWLPQNDLLGHPKTRAFITHGGTNGVYEAIYHGVPMLGFPLFGDQKDNLLRVQTRGVAIILDITMVTAPEIQDALGLLINNSSYQQSMERLSRLHHDQPERPIDRAVHALEFVMRHGHARHLRPAAHRLAWYQLHCLDVLAFLSAAAGLALALPILLCRLCCHCRRAAKVAAKKDKKE
ncbi:UDP-glucuronosyltransferase 2A2-like [Lethenteron reissneri]|uniref:UDP-glucuronosyltransferase 2A2-like n=1 Tax=Lethenteron reissneri TaxID=7753 RepID=UPI002AB741CE|nr:UDP-glucuronosyltransferase 2A2-like [Lethenteron reissneri]